MANIFDKIVESMNNMIRTIKFSAEQVAATSQQLSASSTETGQTSSQIAMTINEIADGSTRQSEHVRTVLEMIEDNSRLVLNADSTMKNTIELSRSSTEAVQNGKNAMDELINQLGIVEKTVEIASKSIGKLGKQSEEIGSIITVISTISEQTNLLALNAAIEAARAGEHGKGFAVVAEEVRKLAEESNKSAQQITELIKGIQSETDITIQAMDQKVEAVENQSLIIEKKRRVLENIVDKVSQTEVVTGEMKRIFDRIKDNSKLVLEAAQESSSIIEETAAASEEVAAASEEQAATVAELADSASELATIAHVLNEEVTKFKI